jgi:hypothetical protein
MRDFFVLTRPGGSGERFRMVFYASTKGEIVFKVAREMPIRVLNI